MTSSDVMNSGKIDGEKESAWWIGWSEQQVTDMQTEDWKTSPSQQIDRESQSFSGRKKKATNKKYRTVELISGSWAPLFFKIMRFQQ